MFLIFYAISSSTEASLFLTRDFDQDESIKEENIMYSYRTYIAENAETLNLVEGEKVFVLGRFIVFNNDAKSPKMSNHINRKNLF